MLRFGRDQSVTQLVTPGGVPLLLEAERWWFRVLSKRGGFGFVYERPVAVKTDGSRTRIPDLVALTRMTALFAVVAVPLARRVWK